MSELFMLASTRDAYVHALEAENKALEDSVAKLEARRDSLLGGVLLLRENLDRWDEKTLRLKILEITRAALTGEPRD